MRRSGRGLCCEHWGLLLGVWLAPASVAPRRRPVAVRPLRTLARSPVLSVLSALTTLYLGGVMLAVVQFAAAAERKLKPCRLWLPVFRCLQKPLPTCSRLLPGWAESCRHQQLPLCRLSLKGISLVHPRALTCPPLLRLHDRSLPLTLSRPWCVPALRTSLLLLLPCLFGLPPRGGTVASAP